MLAVVCVATALGLLVSRLAAGEGSDIPWGAVAVWVATGIGDVRRRALRRAIELNDEPAAADGNRAGLSWSRTSALGRAAPASARGARPSTLFATV